MLAIRLSRTGSKKRPFFRLVVSDSERARDGRFVEILGHYNPRQVPAVVEVNHERIAYWLKAGARPSDTVRTLLAGHVTNQPAGEAPAATTAAGEPRPAPSGPPEPEGEASAR
jgi:small subunit ribosomal protein S16